MGCGSRVAYAPPAPASVQPASIPVPFDDAWKAVIQTFFDSNIPIRTVEKASGIVESEDLRGEVGRDCDCGTYLGLPIGGYGGAYGGDAYYRFRVLVDARGEQETVLTLRSSCRARVGSIEGELVCHLSPSREEQLQTAIRARATASSER
jgi:hypothetical protein